MNEDTTINANTDDNGKSKSNAKDDADNVAYNKVGIEDNVYHKEGMKDRHDGANKKTGGDSKKKRKPRRGSGYTASQRKRNNNKGLLIIREQKLVLQEEEDIKKGNCCLILKQNLPQSSQLLMIPLLWMNIVQYNQKETLQKLSTMLKKKKKKKKQKIVTSLTPKNLLQLMSILTVSKQLNPSATFGFQLELYLNLSSEVHLKINERINKQPIIFVT